MNSIIVSQIYSTTTHVPRSLVTSLDGNEAVSKHCAMAKVIQFQFVEIPGNGPTLVVLDGGQVIQPARLVAAIG
jgi:hypothetical protein